MSNIKKFETNEMAAARIDRNVHADMKESSARMQKIMDKKAAGEDISDRTLLEAKMTKAIADGDDAEFERVKGILERLDRVQMSSIDGGKKD